MIFLCISIHAPRGGSDMRRISSDLYGIISIHAPRGGSDLLNNCHWFVNIQFQSTLPVGGATRVYIMVPKGARDISIHAPRGGSDAINARNVSAMHNFNPRSPWGERPSIIDDVRPPEVFQSTLPVGGATPSDRSPEGFMEFQSTLPVGGATPSLKRCITLCGNFNPRSPWGERRGSL